MGHAVEEASAAGERPRAFRSFARAAAYAAPPRSLIFAAPARHCLVTRPVANHEQVSGLRQRQRASPHGPPLLVADRRASKHRQQDVVRRRVNRINHELSRGCPWLKCVRGILGRRHRRSDHDHHGQENLHVIVLRKSFWLRAAHFLRPRTGPDRAAHGARRSRPRVDARSAASLRRDRSSSGWD